MLTSIEKTLILSGSMLGSIYLFATSLNSINDGLLRRNVHNVSEDRIIDAVAVNSITMFYSATIFTYLAYVASN